LQQVLVPDDARCLRLRLDIQGAVQGVGFRPFLLRLATELGLRGWVSNTARGVLLEVDGQSRQLQAFLTRLEQDKPVHAVIQGLESSFHEPAGFTTFQIRPSDPSGAKSALVLPDYATCEDCLRDILAVNGSWRGSGEIAESGLGLSESYADFDAEKRFGSSR
jgi:hydrogenase maturation factor HypF (carbamoyltransferase family)